MQSKKRDRITFITVCILFSVIFIAFVCWILHIGSSRMAQYENSPDKRAGWEWVSEDGNVSMYTVNIDGTNKVFGTIRSDEKEIPISITFHFGQMIVSELDCNGNHIRNIEIWYGDFTKPDDFTVEVYKTTYLQEGKKIRFQRIPE